MPIPTPEQVQQEIAALKEIKPNVRHYSMFGDDNHAKIEAQIEVLEKDLSTDDIWDCWGNDEDSEMLSNAEEARAWLDGEREGSLVSDWVPLT